MLIEINGRVQPKPMSLKKFFYVLIANVIGLLFLGIIVFIDYTIDIGFIIEKSLIQYILFAVMINFVGLIINFQILGILVDKTIITSLRDGFRLTSKFLNPKILLILIEENIFLMINILNGTFTGLICFINLIGSFYLIEFYLKEMKKEGSNETSRGTEYKS